MPLAVPWGLFSRDRGANNYWIRAPRWKQEQKHLSSATRRLRGPKALLVRLPSYISGGCCIIETLKSLWFPHEWSSGVTWRALSCTWKQKEPASLLREEGKKKKLIKSQKYGPLSIEQQDRSRVFTHWGEPNSWGRICRNKRGGRHPLGYYSPALLLESYDEGEESWWCLKEFKKGGTGRLLEYKSKICVTGLVSRCESGPGLICPPVIVLGIRHLHVVTESDENFGLPQLLHRRPLAQLEREQKRSRKAGNEIRSILGICITLGLYWEIRMLWRTGCLLSQWIKLTF